MSAETVRFGRRPFLTATAAAIGSWAVPGSFTSLLRAAESRRKVLPLRPITGPWESVGL